MIAMSLVLLLASLVVGCASFSQHAATNRGPYTREVAFAREETLSRLIRALATAGLQMSADRPSGVISVPNVALRPGMFDCNLLLQDGVPSYTITAAAATIQFVVDGDDTKSTIRCNALFGVVSYVTQIGIQRIGRETCYSTHFFEDSIVTAAVGPR